MNYNRRTLFFLAVVVAASSALGFGQEKKSLVIGIDGLGFGTHGFSVAATPNMDALINGTWLPNYHGAYSEESASNQWTIDNSSMSRQ